MTGNLMPVAVDMRNWAREISEWCIREDHADLACIYRY